MFLLLLALKNNHSDVRVLLRLSQLFLDLAHKFDVYVDVFIRIKLALHWCDRKHLFCLRLLHSEVKADGVLPLILEVERQLFWLTDSDSPEVKFGRHSLVKRDVERLCIDLDNLVLLLFLIVFNVLYLQYNFLEELHAFKRVEGHFDRLRLAGFKSTRGAQKQLL